MYRLTLEHIGQAEVYLRLIKQFEERCIQENRNTASLGPLYRRFRHDDGSVRQDPIRNFIGMRKGLQYMFTYQEKTVLTELINAFVSENKLAGGDGGYYQDLLLQVLTMRKTGDKIYERN